VKRKPAKILLADDDEMVRLTVSNILEVFGHQVETAEDGTVVLDIVDDSFDLIILDINMPKKDGFETIEELNALGLDIPTLF
jgi:putative two-component system response regulator